MDGKQYTTIKLQTYNCKLHIKVVDSVSKEVLKLYKKHRISEEFNGEAEGATLTGDLNNYYILLGNRYLSHNTIAHEVFHVATRITEDRDIRDEESQAWVAGFITGAVYKFLDKKKLTVKHG